MRQTTIAMRKTNETVYLATIRIAIKANNMPEAEDAVSEAFRPLLALYNNDTSFLDWRYDKGEESRLQNTGIVFDDEFEEGQYFDHIVGRIDVNKTGTFAPYVHESYDPNSYAFAVYNIAGECIASSAGYESALDASQEATRRIDEREWDN